MENLDLSSLSNLAAVVVAAAVGAAAPALVRWLRSFVKRTDNKIDDQVFNAVEAAFQKRESNGGSGSAS